MSRARSQKMRELTLFFASILTPYARTRLAASLLLVLVTSVIVALGPLLLKLVVDGFAEGSSPVVLPVIALAVLYVLVQWLGRVLDTFRNYIQAQADRRIDRTLSDKTFRHILQLPLRFHLDRQTGAVCETLTNGLAGHQMVMQTLVFTLLPVILQLATVVVVLVSLDQMALMFVFLLALAFYAATFAYGTSRITQAAAGAAEAQVEARAVMTDSILNYETVKYFTAEPHVTARLGLKLDRTESEWIRFARSWAMNGLLIGTIFGLFIGVTILYAVHEVMQGRMTVGTFVLINTYAFQLVSPVEQIGFATQQVAQGVALLEKLVDLFREKPEGSSRSSVTAATMDDSLPGGDLEFEHVGASYQSNRAVLKDVSFTLPAGKTLGIVGASGAGKSTLVRLLVRFIDPDDGRILLGGVPIDQLDLSRLRQAIAVVPQDTLLFNDTIVYNIGFGRPESSQQDIERAARIARLHDFIMSQPDGYDTRVGERGVKLSGGEKQRLSIARAVLKRPSIYVFDEATSSLDSRTERGIVESLGELSRHATTLVIAHRLSTVVHADMIVVLDDGRIVESGTHASLLFSGGRYSSLWELQQAPGHKAAVISA